MAGWSEREPALTPRQRDVLERLAQGRTNAEIAAELGIGYETVKMHVAHVLAALDVSTREEAARWWKAKRRLAPRLQWGWFSTAGIKVAAAAGVFAVAVGTAAVVLTVGGSDEPNPGSAGITSTIQPGTPSTSSPTPISTVMPTPFDVGWEAAAAALSFEYSSFKADALQTNLYLVLPEAAAFRETGPALVWVTDTAGVRTRFVQQDSDSLAPRGIREFQGPALSSTPGELLIEIEPVRQNVVPPLGESDAIPKWATYRVPFNGYTGNIREVSPPPPVDFAGGTLTVTEVLVSELQTRVSARFEGPQPSQIGSPVVLYSPDGTVHYGSGGGRGEGSVTTIVYRYPPLSGPVTWLVRESPPIRCPDPDAGDRPTPSAAPTPGTTWVGECSYPLRPTTLAEMRSNFGFDVAEIPIVLP